MNLVNKIAKSRFLIRFYGVNEQGEPGEILYHQPIMIYVDGNNDIEIQISLKK